MTGKSGGALQGQTVAHANHLVGLLSSAPDVCLEVVVEADRRRGRPKDGDGQGPDVTWVYDMLIDGAVKQVMIRCLLRLHKVLCRKALVLSSCVVRGHHGG